jgi:arylsulfatase A-like enzyme
VKEDETAGAPPAPAEEPRADEARPDASPPPPAGAAEPLRAVVLRALVAGVVGAAGVALSEWLLLVVLARDLFAGPGQIALLLPLGFGNLLAYACAAAVALAFVDFAARRATGRVRWPRVAAASVLGVASLPYAIWLGIFVFSGPQARAMAGRPILVALCSLVVAATFAVGAGFSLLRRASRRASVPIVGALALATAGLLWLSRSVFQQEYGPLHLHLGLWAVLLAVLAGRELSGALAHRVGPRVVAIGAAATLAWAIAASVILARADGYAWIVWQETGASRYLTSRLKFLTPERVYTGGSLPMVLKPDVENASTKAARKQRASDPAPDIVVFSIDGLRKDHVGAYGYETHPTTPNIDRFAKRGVVFQNAVSSYPATQVFNSMLLLGRAVPLYEGDQQPVDYRSEAISNLLDRRGYHVFVKSWLEHSSRSEFDPAPFHIDTYVPKSKSTRHMEPPMEEGLAKLAAHLAEADERKEPVFAWFHLLATHAVGGGKFRPHPDYDFGEGRMDRYDSAVAGSDLWLQHIEKMMAERGGSRPTIWIICSDHGANADKSSRDLYDPIVRVPLIVVMPDVAPRKESALVDTALDLAATVVDLAGIAPPKGYDGISLVPILTGTAGKDPVAHRIVPLGYIGLTGAVYDGFKHIKDDASVSLFDLGADPREKRNLVGERGDLLDQMVHVAEEERRRRMLDAEDAGGGRTKKAKKPRPAKDDDEDGEPAKPDKKKKKKKSKKKARPSKDDAKDDAKGDDEDEAKDDE